MTGAQIITMFETLIDDTLDSDLEYQLLNQAKNQIEDERDWSMLKKCDSSQSATTSAITLPADYRRTIALYVNNQPYMQIPFEQKNLMAYSALSWYLDFANGTYYLLGSNLSGTVYHYYIKTTSDVESATSPVWPSRFHPLIAYDMAEMWWQIDQGDRSRSWDDKWAVKKELLRRSMVDWDTSLQKRAVENALPADFDNEFPLSMM